MGNHDRTGSGSAELIAPKFALTGVEEVARVEQVVAHVLEERQVRLVRAALERHRHHAPGETAVLGGVAGGLQLEFLERIEWRASLRAGIARIKVVQAIDG